MVRAWVFLGLVLVGTIATLVLVFPGREDLLDERFKSARAKGQPLADKIITLLLIAAFLGVIVFIPLDIFRFQLMSKPVALVSVLGLILIIVGWWIISLVFKENAFAAPVVKHQEERHQTVIDTGVYAIVRHPMYAGAIMPMVGLPLWLESYAAALLVCVPTALIVVRSVRGTISEARAEGLRRLYEESSLQTDPVCLVSEKNPALNSEYKNPKPCREPQLKVKIIRV